MIVEKNIRYSIKDLISAIRLFNLINDKKSIDKCIKIGELSLNIINYNVYSYDYDSCIFYRLVGDVLSYEKTVGNIMDFSVKYDMGKQTDISIELPMHTKFTMTVLENISKGEIDCRAEQLRDM